MQNLWTFVQNNPWILAVVGFGLAAWIGALVAIVRATKFRRKWLWALLTLLSFSWSWEVGPGETLSVGFPLGALYVLWFWRFGPSPPGTSRQPG
jgi:hypothetical protein